MKLDYQKELTPVLYGDSAVKIIHNPFIGPERYGFTMHWHDRMELLLIYSGSLTVNCGGTEKEISVGEVAIFPPCLPHSGFVGKDGVSYDAVMFDVSKFFNATGTSERFLSPLQSQRISFVNFTKDGDIIASLSEIIRLYDNGEPTADIMTVGEIYRLIGLLFKSCISEKGMAFTESGRFKEVFDFINENFCEDISTSTLSRKFGYDETYFCRRFKKITGLTPTVYIRILRLEKAKKLIKKGSMSVSDVAAACAFSDAAYFTRCFKKHFGVTPQEYGAKYKR